MMYQFIPKSPQGRRFAISDIHGCSQTFRKLIWEKIQLEKTDQLFLLGDYINRGPDSAGVLDTILRLQKDEYQVFALRGNHEQMVIDYQSKSSIGTPSYLKKNGLFDKEKNINPDYQQFIETLPYYFELEDFYLVHAGFDFENENPFENTYAMMNLPKFEINKKLVNGKIIIKGHTPVAIPETLNQIENRVQSQVICIDSGCFIQEEPFGNLSALNLDTFELIWQESRE